MWGGDRCRDAISPVLIVGGMITLARSIGSIASASSEKNHYRYVVKGVVVEAPTCRWTLDAGRLVAGPRGAGRKRIARPQRIMPHTGDA
jgi:hypothetical protein